MERFISVHHIIASGIIERDKEGNTIRMTGFNWDVTENKAREERIRNINAELEEKVMIRTKELQASNGEMEAFSYSVSHDLRAPLRSIIGFTSILEEEYSSQLDNEAKRITAIIKNNTLKMANLVDDLLSFSRLGRQQIKKIILYTNEMVMEVITEIGNKKQWKRNTLDNWKSS